MLAAEEIIQGALKAGLAAYYADETAFRTIFRGYATARVNALWTDMQTVDRRPAVEVEFYRHDTKIPLFLVSTASEEPETTEAGGYATLATAGETVRVGVVGRTRHEVNELTDLAKAALWAAHLTVVRAQVGCDGYTYRGKSGIAPFDAQGLDPGLQPEELLVRDLIYLVQSEHSPSIPASIAGGDNVEALAVIREGYTDESIPLDGGVEFGRA